MEIFKSPEKIVAFTDHYCDGRFGRFITVSREKLSRCAIYLYPVLKDCAQ
jgi:hypothetical protein